MNHAMLMALTERMPCKVIPINSIPYLERYYAGPADSGGMWMLHRFLTSDPEKHLHTHSFSARVTVLCGGYSEEVMQGEGAGRLLNQLHYRAGDHRLLYPSTLHRVVSVLPNTWTLLHVLPGRLPTWRFIDDDGSEKIMQASAEDWFLDYKPMVAA